RALEPAGILEARPRKPRIAVKAAIGEGRRAAEFGLVEAGIVLEVHAGKIAAGAIAAAAESRLAGERRPAQRHVGRKAAAAKPGILAEPDFGKRGRSGEAGRAKLGRALEGRTVEAGLVLELGALEIGLAPEYRSACVDGSVELGGRRPQAARES